VVAKEPDRNFFLLHRYSGVMSLAPQWRYEPGPSVWTQTEDTVSALRSSMLASVIATWWKDENVVYVGNLSAGLCNERREEGERKKRKERREIRDWRGEVDAVVRIDQIYSGNTPYHPLKIQTSSPPC
jgi:hypothetical protein